MSTTVERDLKTCQEQGYPFTAILFGGSRVEFGSGIELGEGHVTGQDPSWDPQGPIALIRIQRIEILDTTAVQVKRDLAWCFSKRLDLVLHMKARGSMQMNGFHIQVKDGLVTWNNPETGRPFIFSFNDIERVEILTDDS